MKIKQIVLASAMIVSFSTFAQKDELKGLKKIYEKQSIADKDIAAVSRTIPGGWINGHVRFNSSTINLKMS